MEQEHSQEKQPNTSTTKPDLRQWLEIRREQEETSTKETAREPKIQMAKLAKESRRQQHHRFSARWVYSFSPRTGHTPRESSEKDSQEPTRSFKAANTTRMVRLREPGDIAMEENQEPTRNPKVPKEARKGSRTRDRVSLVITN